ncbi:hypothetical protein HMPREF3208_01364, partial [Gardnerella vaginalis]
LAKHDCKATETFAGEFPAFVYLGRVQVHICSHFIPRLWTWAECNARAV